MTPSTPSNQPPPTGLRAWLKLLRLHQWAKGAFVLVGPLYGHALSVPTHAAAAFAAFLSFGLASSSCYIVNDYKDREADRLHPRKRRRPLAAGTISPRAALSVAAVLVILALATPWLAFALGAAPMPHATPSPTTAATAVTTKPIFDLTPTLAATLLSIALAVYIINTLLYSIIIKHIVIADVMSLSFGFVIRVLGGCAAVLVQPSTWLLNTTLFLAMFLAFGKRLGERRTIGEVNVASTRGVQAQYTEDLLRMTVVVTAVACLVTYAAYVNSPPSNFTFGFNLLWLTMIPATFGLLRAILLLEKGDYDDPTELALHDRPFQLAAALFAITTLALMALMPRLLN